MRATIDGTVIAEAPESDLIKIEGNWYFPPSAVTEVGLAVTVEALGETDPTANVTVAV